MTLEEDREYAAIIYGQRDPEAAPFEAGRQDRRTGKAFNQNPYDRWSVSGLSWRLGWNDEALRLADGPAL